ncbi:MAG: hypothetical protein ACRDKE_11885, partial [Solirubrobacterales bacterium]
GCTVSSPGVTCEWTLFYPLTDQNCRLAGPNSLVISEPCTSPKSYPGTALSGPGRYELRVSGTSPDGESVGLVHEFVIP